MVVGLVSPDSVLLEGNDITSDPTNVRLVAASATCSISGGLTVEQNLLAILENSHLDSTTRYRRMMRAAGRGPARQVAGLHPSGRCSGGGSSITRAPAGLSPKFTPSTSRSRASIPSP